MTLCWYEHKIMKWIWSDIVQRDTQRAKGSAMKALCLSNEILLEKK